MKPVYFWLVFLLCGFWASPLAFAQKARIKFESTVFDFGDMGEKGGNHTHKFEFTNTGDAPLIITKVTASCGCTTPGWTKEVIMPGKTGFVNVEYNPEGRVGPMEKTVTVISNAEPEAVTLTIKGEVVSVDLTPLPVPIEYMQYFGYDSKVITASDAKFEAFVEKLVPLVKKNGTLSIAIESSASHVPTQRYKSNELLTRSRASEARVKITEMLKQKGIDAGKLIFADDKTLIQGPAYRKDSKTNMEEYEKYQYIKINAL